MENLTPEERKELGRKAAAARWANTGIDRAGAQVHTTNHGGALNLGPTVIACAVLPGEIRVISERALVKAFGGKRGGAHWRRKTAGLDGANLPIVLSAGNLQQFIDDELREGLQERYVYQVKKSGALANGIRAELLPKICDVYLKARDAGMLARGQHDMAIAADILVRSLAQVGIIALVDEATGFQSERDRNSLQAFLAKLIGKELAKWERRFPQDYYRAIFRLKGWDFDETSTKRPMQMAKITADIIYDRLGPGVLDELRAKNPVDQSGRRKAKHHQWLTPDVGHPVLSRHIDRTMFLADASKTWPEFYDGLGRVAPSLKLSGSFDFGPDKE